MSSRLVSSFSFLPVFCLAFPPSTKGWSSFCLFWDKSGGCVLVPCTYDSSREVCSSISQQCDLTCCKRCNARSPCLRLPPRLMILWCSLSSWEGHTQNTWLRIRSSLGGVGPRLGCKRSSIPQSSVVSNLAWWFWTFPNAQGVPGQGSRWSSSLLQRNWQQRVYLWAGAFE